MRGHGATVAGPMQAWRTLSLSFEGPTRSETPETFTDMRLEVTLRDARSGESLRVQGFFAADGAAADSGAATGNVWRAAFTPPSDGEWVYRASFRTGANISADPAPETGGAGGSPDAIEGRLWIAPARAGGLDLRGLGPVALLEEGYVFPRSGASAPERFGPETTPPLLLSSEFDGLGDGSDQGASQRQAAGREAWRASDPVWARGRGKAVIGGLNRLAAEGLTAVWAAPLMIGVDGEHGLCWRVSPWADDDETGLSYDISRLAQWEIVFTHAQSLGLVVNMDLGWPDRAAAPTTVARRVFLREMVARFAHHNGLVWRLRPDSEDAAFLRAIDAYQRPIAPPLSFGRLEAIRVPRPAAARLPAGTAGQVRSAANADADADVDAWGGGETVDRPGADPSDRGPARREDWDDEEPVRDEPVREEPQLEDRVRNVLLRGERGPGARGRDERERDREERERELAQPRRSREVDPAPEPARPATVKPEASRRQPPTEPFETRLEQGLRRLQAALGWAPAEPVEEAREQQRQEFAEAPVEEQPAPFHHETRPAVEEERPSRLSGAGEEAFAAAEAELAEPDTALDRDVWRDEIAPARAEPPQREQAAPMEPEKSESLSLAASLWRAGFGRRSKPAPQPAVEAAPARGPARPRSPEGGSADIQIGLSLLHAAADRPELTPVDREAGLLAAQLRDVEVNLLARLSGEEAELARSARLSVDDGAFEQVATVDPYAIFEDVGAGLLAELKKSGVARLRVELFETEDASGAPLRWWSAPLLSAKPAAEAGRGGPSWRRRGRGAEGGDEMAASAGPLELRSVELIDTEADHPIGMLTGRGVIERRAVLGRQITLKVTLGGEGVDAVETLKATLESARARQADADRPYVYADEKVAHFYKLAFERGEQSLLIEAYRADARAQAPLLATRVDFVVR